MERNGERNLLKVKIRIQGKTEMISQRIGKKGNKSGQKGAKYHDQKISRSVVSGHSLITSRLSPAGAGSGIRPGMSMIILP